MFVVNFNKIENFEFTSLDVDYLKHYNNCPVCGSDKRSHKVNSPDQDQYNLYFQAIASYLKTTQVELHKKINVYVCKNVTLNIVIHGLKPKYQIFCIVLFLDNIEWVGASLIIGQLTKKKLILQWVI